jgi:hypothetical protein
MTPLLLTLNSLVLPDHSSNRYTPPLTVAAALIETGDVTLAPSVGEQTLMPLADGAEHWEFVKVNVAVLTLLCRYPGALAIALMVVFELTVIGPVYSVDAGVGVDPSSV